MQAILQTLAIGGVNQTWWIHCLYLTNFHVAWQGHWDGSSHLWSLSVEEQFYLIWFVVVMVFPKRFFVPSMLFCIVGAPVFRAAALLLGFNGLVAYVMLPACMDALAAGAILAYLALSPQLSVFHRALRDPRLFGLSLACLAATYYLGHLGDYKIGFVFLWPVAINFVSASIIWICTDPAPNWSVDWLALWPVRHIGQISYGIYIFHYFVPQVLQKYFPGIDLLTRSPYPEVVRLFILVGISVIVAELSWMLVERPVLRWRNWVRIPSAAAMPAVVSVQG